MTGDVEHTLLAIAPRLDAWRTEALRPQNTAHRETAARAWELQTQLRKNRLNIQTHFHYYVQELKPDNLNQKSTKLTTA